MFQQQPNPTITASHPFICPHSPLLHISSEHATRSLQPPPNAHARCIILPPYPCVWLINSPSLLRLLHPTLQLPFICWIVRPFLASGYQGVHAAEDAGVQKRQVGGAGGRDQLARPTPLHRQLSRCSCQARLCAPLRVVHIRAGDSSASAPTSTLSSIRYRRPIQPPLRLVICASLPPPWILLIVLAAHLISSSPLLRSATTATCTTLKLAIAIWRNTSASIAYVHMCSFLLTTTHCERLKCSQDHSSNLTTHLRHLATPFQSPPTHHTRSPRFHSGATSL